MSHLINGNSTVPFILQFPFFEVSKCEIKCQLLKEDYISRLQNFFLILNGIAKAKLVVLAFLYSRESVKNPRVPPLDYMHIC